MKSRTEKKKLVLVATSPRTDAEEVEKVKRWIAAHKDFQMEEFHVGSGGNHTMEEELLERLESGEPEAIVFLLDEDIPDMDISTAERISHRFGHITLLEFRDRDRLTTMSSYHLTPATLNHIIAIIAA